MAKRPSKCTICSHREASNIDLALSRGVSVTALSRRYKVSTDSLYRHSNNHLPPQLRAKLIAGPDLDIDLDRLKETESQSLLANLVAYAIGYLPASTSRRSAATASWSRAWQAHCTPIWN